MFPFTQTKLTNGTDGVNEFLQFLPQEETPNNEMGQTNEFLQLLPAEEEIEDEKIEAARKLNDAIDVLRLHPDVYSETPEGKRYSEVSSELDSVLAEIDSIRKEKGAGKPIDNQRFQSLEQNRKALQREKSDLYNKAVPTEFKFSWDFSTPLEQQEATGRRFDEINAAKENLENLKLQLPPEEYNKYKIAARNTDWKKTDEPYALLPSGRIRFRPEVFENRKSFYATVDKIVKEYIWSPEQGEVARRTYDDIEKEQDYNLYQAAKKTKSFQDYEKSQKQLKKTERQIWDEYKTSQGFLEKAGYTVGVLTKGAVDTVAFPAAGVAINAINTLADVTGSKKIEEAARVATQKTIDMISEPSYWKDVRGGFGETADTAAQTLGQVIGQLTLVAVAKKAGGPKLASPVASSVGITAPIQVGMESYLSVYNANAIRDEKGNVLNNADAHRLAAIAMRKAMPSGLLDMLPLESILRKVPATMLGKTIKATVSGLLETGTENLQQKWGNKVNNAVGGAYVKQQDMSLAQDIGIFAPTAAIDLITGKIGHPAQRMATPPVAGVEGVPAMPPERPVGTVPISPEVQQQAAQAVATSQNLRESNANATADAFDDIVEGNLRQKVTELRQEGVLQPEPEGDERFIPPEERAVATEITPTPEPEAPIEKTAEGKAVFEQPPVIQTTEEAAPELAPEITELGEQVSEEKQPIQEVIERANAIGEKINSDIKAGLPSRSPQMEQSYAELGETIDPEIRLSEKRELGMLYAMFLRGEATAAEFNKAHQESRDMLDSLRGIEPSFKLSETETLAPQKQVTPTKATEPKPSLGKPHQLKAEGSVSGQTKAANRGARIAVLIGLNSRIAKIAPELAYKQSELTRIAASQIDAVRDYLISQYNKIATQGEPYATTTEQEQGGVPKEPQVGTEGGETAETGTRYRVQREEEGAAEVPQEIATTPEGLLQQAEPHIGIHGGIKASYNRLKNAIESGAPQSTIDLHASELGIKLKSFLGIKAKVAPAPKAKPAKARKTASAPVAAPAPAAENAILPEPTKPLDQEHGKGTIKEGNEDAVVGMLVRVGATNFDTWQIVEVVPPTALEKKLGEQQVVIARVNKETGTIDPASKQTVNWSDTRLIQTKLGNKTAKVAKKLGIKLKPEDPAAFAGRSNISTSQKSNSDAKQAKLLQKLYDLGFFKEGITLKEILTNFLGEKMPSWSRTVLKKIVTIAGDLDVKIDVVFHPEATYAAYCQARPDGTYTIVVNVAKTYHQLVPKFLHEAVHVISVVKITKFLKDPASVSAADRKRIEEIQKIYEEVKANKRLDGMYAATNLNEFVAEVLSDVATRKAILAYGDEQMSLIRRLLRAIGRLVFGENFAPSSDLDLIFRNVVEMAGEAYSTTTGKDANGNFAAAINEDVSMVGDETNVEGQIEDMQEKLSQAEGLEEAEKEQEARSRFEKSMEEGFTSKEQEDLFNKLAGTDWVEMMVRKWRNRNPNVDSNEYMSAVFEGLFLAAKSFDPSRGASFKTWATTQADGQALNLARKTTFRQKKVGTTAKVTAEGELDIEEITPSGRMPVEQEVDLADFNRSLKTVTDAIVSHYETKYAGTSQAWKAEAARLLIEDKLSQADVAEKMGLSRASLTYLWAGRKKDGEFARNEAGEIIDEGIQHRLVVGLEEQGWTKQDMMDLFQPEREVGVKGARAEVVDEFEQMRERAAEEGKVPAPEGIVAEPTEETEQYAQEAKQDSELLESANSMQGRNAPITPERKARLDAIRESSRNLANRYIASLPEGLRRVIRLVDADGIYSELTNDGVDVSVFRGSYYNDVLDDMSAGDVEKLATLAVQEEIIHAIDQAIDFVSYPSNPRVLRRARSSGIVSQLKKAANNSKTGTAIKQLVEDSYSLYRQGEQIGYEQILDGLESGEIQDYRFVSEMLRQIVQLRVSGEITEGQFSNVRGLVNEIIKWIRSAIDRMRSLVETDFVGSEMLNNRAKEIEAIVRVAEQYAKETTVKPSVLPEDIGAVGRTADGGTQLFGEAAAGTTRLRTVPSGLESGMEYPLASLFGSAGEVGKVASRYDAAFKQLGVRIEYAKGDRDANIRTNADGTLTLNVPDVAIENYNAQTLDDVLSDIANEIVTERYAKEETETYPITAAIEEPTNREKEKAPAKKKYDIPKAETDQILSANPFEDRGKKTRTPWKKLFTAAGKLPRELFEMIKGKEQLIRSYVAKTEFTTKRYYQAIKDEYKRRKESIPYETISVALGNLENRLTDDQYKAMMRLPKVEDRIDFEEQALLQNLEAYKARQKEALDSLPPKVQEAVQEMRRSIDDLSTRMRDEGLITDSLKAIIDRNMGVWLHRSYRIFDDPQFNSFIRSSDPQAEMIRNKAEALFINHIRARKAVEYMNAMKDADTPVTKQEALAYVADLDVTEEAKTMLSDYIAIGDKDSIDILRGRLPGAKNLSIIKVRGQIPAEVRALWGQYTDAEVNFAKSQISIASYLAKEQFLKEFLDWGINTGMLWKEGLSEGVRPPNFVQITGEGSKTMMPMEGVWGPPMLRDGLAEYNEVLKQDFWSTLTLAAMQAKTVYSIGSIIRNFLGNPAIALFNGNMFFGDMGKSIQGTWDNFFKSTGGSREQLIIDAVRLGVLGENVGPELIRQLSKQSIDFTVGEKFPQKALSHLAEKLSKVKTTFEGMYNAADDFWKIYNWTAEIAKLKWANKEMTNEEAMVEAARIVRSTTPTYSEAWVSVRSLLKKKFGNTFAPFVTFTTEIIRTSYNSIRLTQEQLKSDNPRVRMLGAYRLAGQLAIGTMPFMLAKLSKSLFGYDDDDEEAIRRGLPAWQQNASIIWLPKDKNGNPRFIDLSYLNPYNYFFDAVKAGQRAIVNGETPKDAAIDATGVMIWELIRPFISEQIAFGAAMDVARNMKSSGARVYNPKDTPTRIVLDVMGRVANAFVPGTLDSATRMGKAAIGYVEPTGRAYDLATEIAAPFTGQRILTYDPKKTLEFKVGQFKGGKSDSAQLLNSVAKSKGTVFEGDIARGLGLDVASAYERANNAMYETVNELRKDYLAAIKLGMSQSDANKLMKELQVGEKYIKAVKSGVYKKLDPSDESWKEIGEIDKNRKSLLKQAVKATPDTKPLDK